MKLHRIKALLLNYYYFSINSVDRIFDIIYWPIIDMLIWGFMTFFISNIAEVNVVNSILGGIILWIFVWRSSQDFVVYLLEHYWSRSIYHLFVTPVKAREFIASLCILGVLRGVVSFTVLIGISAVFYKFNFFTINFFHASIFILVLILFGWGLGLLVSSFVFRWGSRVQVLAWSSIWIIQPFSCVFYPLSALPSWAASIAKWLPTTQVFEALRASLAGTSVNWGSIVYAFGFNIMFIILAAFILADSIKKAKKNGSFSKPE
jgi:ABC-2 type transport system permease protein